MGLLSGFLMYIFYPLFTVFVCAGDARRRHENPNTAAPPAQPYLAEPVTKGGGMYNVTAQLGVTAYLHCKVNNLGGNVVS